MNNMTTSDGRIAISLKEMMIFADIEEKAELLGYDKLIRSPLDVEFQRLPSVTWDRNYNNGSRMFKFYRTASLDTIRQILSNNLLTTVDEVVEQKQSSSSPGDN